jgi:hypothetical protein
LASSGSVADVVTCAMVPKAPQFKG